MALFLGINKRIAEGFDLTDRRKPVKKTVYLVRIKKAARKTPQLQGRDGKFIPILGEAQDMALMPISNYFKTDESVQEYLKDRFKIIGGDKTKRHLYL